MVVYALTNMLQYLDSEMPSDCVCKHIISLSNKDEIPHYYFTTTIFWKKKTNEVLKRRVT